MSKVEDKAKEFLKKLVSHTTLYEGTIDELEVYEPDDVILAYKEGCQQAEKDMGLSWKDMAEIVKIANLLEIEWLNSTPWDGIRDCGFYAEVLKRFKERKGK